MVAVVSTLSEFKEIIAKDEYSVFDFWATWCGPCRVISPVFEALSKENESVKFYKVDVDEAEDVSREVNITAMPTFVLFKNGQEVNRLRGVNPDGLTALIKQANAAKA